MKPLSVAGHLAALSQFSVNQHPRRQGRLSLIDIYKARGEYLEIHEHYYQEIVKELKENNK